MNAPVPPPPEPTREQLLAALAERDRELAEAREARDATAEILKVIASSPGDAQPVFRAIAAAARRLIGGHSAAVARFIDGFASVVAVTSTNPAADAAALALPPRPIANSPILAAYREGRAHIIPDIEADDCDGFLREAARKRGWRSCVFVPLMGRDEPLGSVTVERATPGTFAADEVQLLKIFADQAVVAIENARQFHETQKALERQTATAEILKVIASSPGDVQPVFDAIARSAKRLLGGFTASVYRIADRVVGVAAYTPTDPEADAAMLATFPRPADDQMIEDYSRYGFVEIANAEAELDGLRLESARARGFQSSLTVPLTIDGALYGAIAVSRRERGKFAPHQIQLLQTFADQAAIAIQNARLFNETRVALERQTATAEILKVIASSPGDTQPVFDAIAETAKRLLGGSTAIVTRIRDGLVHLVAYTRVNPDADATLEAFYPQPIAQISAAVFERLRDQGYWEVRDTEEQYFGKLRESARARGYRSVLSVRLVSEGVAVGGLVVSRAEPGAFAPHHIELLKTFADQAAIAIHNARLFNDTQRALERQTATAEILKVIAASPSDTAPVFDAIAQSANRLLGGLSTAVWRFEGEIAHLAAYTPANPEADAALRALSPLPVRELSVFLALSEGEIAQLPDTEQGPERLRDLARLRGYRAMLFVPLIQQGAAVGFVSVTRKQPGAFDADDVGLLKTFADQAVIAIQNARSLNETKEALDQQRASGEVLAAIGQSVSDAAPVFEKILDACQRLFGGDEVGVYRIDEADMVRVAAWRGDKAEEVRHDVTPLAQSYTGKVIRERRAHHIPDLGALPDISEKLRERVKRLGGAALIYAPMLWKDRGLGSIVVSRAPPRPFSEKEQALLQGFADQAAIAVENARLFNETQARTRDLTEALQQQTATAEVLKVISRSAFDLQAVFDTLVGSAVELIGAAGGSICAREGEHFFAKSIRSPDPINDRVSGRAVPLDRSSLPGRALLSGKIEVIADASNDPEFVFRSSTASYRSGLSVPLLREGRIEGVLTVAMAEPNAITQRHIDLVQTFADQAVIAIENVRLFEQVQARTRELAASLEDLRKTQDRLVQTEKLASLGQLTAGIAHEIKNPLNFVNNFAALSGELTDELLEILGPAPLDAKLREEVGDLTKLLKDNLRKVASHGQRADSIVKNMLLHSRSGSGERRASDVNAILEESLNLAYHGARAEKPDFDITLKRDLDPAAGMVDMYPQEISRAFLNLISNGFYAATRRVADPGFEPALAVATKTIGGGVEIRVRDNGAGIPAGVRDKIFNPFFTTKPAGEGTGLGLSMTHDIVVKQHGGTIEVETAPGEFTEFRIFLPRGGVARNGERGAA